MSNAQKKNKKGNPPYETRHKSKGRSDKSNKESLDNSSASDVPSESPATMGDSPSIQQFLQLSQSVHELSDLVKSLANGPSINPNNGGHMSTSQSDKASNSRVNSSDLSNQTTVDSSSNVSRLRVTANSGHNSLDNTAPLFSGEVIHDVSQPMHIDKDQPVPVNTVDDVLQSHIQSLVEQDFGHEAPGNYEPLDQPLDLKVSDKIKSMIWANRYVDLSVLLDPAIEGKKSSRYDFVGEVGEPVTLAPHKASRSINGLGQWCSAFSVFIVIYCQKYPSELSSLFTYMNTIKRLSHKNGDYLKYDEEFRYMRQSCPLKWNVTHSGLWVDCATSTNNRSSKPKNKSGASNRSNNQNSFPQKKQLHPVGSCFRFHTYGKCDRPSCIFPHVCYNKLCHNAEHPISKCPYASIRGDNSPSNAQARPANPNPKNK